MHKDAINILYVDDEINNLMSFKATFRVTYNIFTATSGEEATKILDANNIHVIITDQRMPNMTGVQFLESIIEKHPFPVRMLLTGYADINAVVDAVNKGKIFHYLSKPWNEEELDRSMQRAYEVYKEKLEEREQTKKLSITNEQLEFLVRQKLLS